MADRQQLIYGVHPVMEALESGSHLDKIVFNESLQGVSMTALRKTAKAHSVHVQQLTKDRFKQFVFKYRLQDANHQGIIAFQSLVPYYTVDDVLQQAYANGETPLLLVLDGVTDTRNFGAIIRTGYAFGVHGIVYSAKGNAQVNHDVIKTSSGAIHKVHLCRVPSLSNTLEELQLNGIQLISTVMDTDTDLNAVDLKLPSAIIMGSEDLGVSPKTLRQSDVQAKIPMTNAFDSLNVSVATGIALYAVQEQRS